MALVSASLAVVAALELVGVMGVVVVEVGWRVALVLGSFFGWLSSSSLGVGYALVAVAGNAAVAELVGYLVQMGREN